MSGGSLGCMIVYKMSLVVLHKCQLPSHSYELGKVSPQYETYSLVRLKTTQYVLSQLRTCARLFSSYIYVRTYIRSHECKQPLRPIIIANKTPSKQRKDCFFIGQILGIQAFQPPVSPFLSATTCRCRCRAASHPPPQCREIVQISKKKSRICME